jgi:hypothetical protein
MALPVESQVPLLLKILSFDRNLESRAGGEIVIGVMHQTRFRRSLEARRAFEQALALGGRAEVKNIPVRAVPLCADDGSDWAARARNEAVDAVYLAPMRAMDLRGILSECRAQRWITCTGVPEYVDAGCAIGVGLQDDRAQVLVNRSSAGAEGMDLSSQLLKLARIILSKTD